MRRRSTWILSAIIVVLLAYIGQAEWRARRSAVTEEETLGRFDPGRVVELSIVAGGRTLHEHAGYRYALYPRCPGRSPELENEDTLAWLGRFIARIHAVGALRRFAHRPQLDVESFGSEPSRFIIEHDFVKDQVAVGEDDRVADSGLQRIRREPRRTSRADNVDGQLNRGDRAVWQWRRPGH